MRCVLCCEVCCAGRRKHLSRPMTWNMDSQRTQTDFCDAESSYCEVCWASMSRRACLGVFDCDWTLRWRACCLNYFILSVVSSACGICCKVCHLKMFRYMFGNIKCCTVFCAFCGLSNQTPSPLNDLWSIICVCVRMSECGLGFPLTASVA